MIALIFDAKLTIIFAKQPNFYHVFLDFYSSIFTIFAQ